MLKHKIKHFLRKNFKISGVFSDHEFDQTDFGRIYFNLPVITEHPKTIEALAATLKHYNKLGRQVTIRNTGHSLNGQTLTNGVQVCVGGLDYASFNKSKMEVTAGCGTSWDSVLKAIHFPQYCLPLFPNNPNQEIHIGGTAAVGGVGPYSSSAGGFWNHVKSLKLVTMEGDILVCSREQNADLFKYSLGGFGRIGVIAEVTVSVKKSPAKVLGLALLTPLKHNFEDILERLMKDSRITAVMSGQSISNNKLLIKYNAEIVSGFFVVFEKFPKDIKAFANSLKKDLKADFEFFLEQDVTDKNGMDLSFSTKLLDKRNLVYWYPNSPTFDNLNNIHAWADYIMSPGVFNDFVHKAKALLLETGFHNQVIHETFFHKFFDVSIIPSYGIKNFSKIQKFDFPLSLDIKGLDMAYITGVFPTIPRAKLSSCFGMIKELDRIAYELGAKRYLYGLHDLTKRQIEKHFGNKTIQQWNKLKDKLDPKHLLNIGVIEHLDDM